MMVPTGMSLGLTVTSVGSKLVASAAVAGWDGMALELVFNWSSQGPAILGTSFGHIAIQVSGITAFCDRLADAGVPMPRPPRSQRHGENIIAFVEDPDGHRIELVQLPS